jgi:DNA-binding NarL/FixJ family response regulator
MTPDDLLAEVKQAAERHRHASKAPAETAEQRDTAIRAAVAGGCNRTQIAQAAGISRGRLYQIIENGESDA